MPPLNSNLTSPQLQIFLKKQAANRNGSNVHTCPYQQIRQANIKHEGHEEVEQKKIQAKQHPSDYQRISGYCCSAEHVC